MRRARLSLERNGLLGIGAPVRRLRKVFVGDVGIVDVVKIQVSRARGKRGNAADGCERRPQNEVPVRWVGLVLARGGFERAVDECVDL